MNTLKAWVIQLRYPYTAGVIAIIWIGGALLAIIRPELSGNVLLLLVAATLIVAVIGFSSSKR